MRKTRLILLILAAAVLAAGVASCNFKKDTETPKFFGKWETKPAEVGKYTVEIWEFNKDGTFKRGFEHRMAPGSKMTVEEYYAELGMEPEVTGELYGTYTVEDGLLTMQPIKVVSGGETEYLQDSKPHEYNYEFYEYDEITELFLKPTPDQAEFIKTNTTVYKVESPKK